MKSLSDQITAALEHARKKAVHGLIEKIGTPSVENIIEYLQERAEFSTSGRMATECSVNKEALRLAAVYLEDAYIYERI